MDANKVLRVEDAVLVLTRGVYDFCRKILAFISNDLAERVFDCWVVAFNEVAVDELNSEGGFA